MTAIAPLTPALLAAELDTDPRTTRKFLRSITPAEDHPGKGARWAIPADKRSIASLRKKFAAWSEAQAAKGTADAEVVATIADAAIEVVDALDAD